MSKRTYCNEQIEGGLTTKVGNIHNSLKQNIDSCFRGNIASFQAQDNTFFLRNDATNADI